LSQSIVLFVIVCYHNVVQYNTSESMGSMAPSWIYYILNLLPLLVIREFTQFSEYTYNIFRQTLKNIIFIILFYCNNEMNNWVHFCTPDDALVVRNILSFYTNSLSVCETT
jgi:hypothetical protein